MHFYEILLCFYVGKIVIKNGIQDNSEKWNPIKYDSIMDLKITSIYFPYHAKNTNIQTTLFHLQNNSIKSAYNLTSGIIV